MRYVDGFLLAVPKKNLKAYKKMAQDGGKLGNVPLKPSLAEFNTTRQDCHMRHLPVILGLLLLPACSAPSEKYDIDVQCKNTSDLNFQTFDQGDGLKKFVCFEDLPSTKRLFEIICDGKTVQIIEDTLLCTTHDGKSVRIRLNK